MTTNGDDPDRDGDPVMEWALGERIGGERPPDLVDAVRERLAAEPIVRRRWRAQLCAAAIVVLGVFVVVAVAVWPRGADRDVATPPVQDPPLPQVHSKADAAALPLTTRGVEAIDVDDATIAALRRLGDLEVLVVREPFHESFGLSPKRAMPSNPKHVTAAAWRDLLSFTKLRRLELSGTLLAGRVTAKQIADDLERLPLLSSLALRYLDTSDELLLVLPRIRGLQRLDLSFNHGFGGPWLDALEGGWIDAVVRCRGLRVLSLRGCQQVRGADLARLGELPDLEDLDLGLIDGVNHRDSGVWLDDTERQVVARSQRLADRLGTGPTDEALAGIAKCSKLRVLDVTGGNWTAAGLARLGACRNLKVLLASGGGNDHSFVASLPASLERLEVGGDYTDAFCTAVADHLPQLRHLTIAACYRITDRGLAKVAAMPSLRVLDMRQMRGLTIASIDALLAATQLEDLDVRHCEFVTAEHVVRLRRSLKHLQRLETSVDPKEIEAAEQMPALRPVVRTKEEIEACLRAGLRAIEGIGLDDEGVAALAGSTRLESLVLRPNREQRGLLVGPVVPFTDAGMRELAKIPTLRALRLDRCRKVTPEGLAVIAQLPVLEELHLIVMSVPDEFFAKLAGLPLKRLTIEGCRDFGRAGVEAVAKLRDLREVSFKGCVHLDEDWISGLAALPRLERLDLSLIGSHTHFSGLSEFGAHVEPGSGVTSRAITALAKLSTLRELSLAYGAVDAAALRGLQAVPTLRSLDLGGTGVTAADLQWLPRTVTRLALGNCSKIGQDFGDVLAKATPQLHTLDLTHGKHLEDACLHSLRSVASLRELDLSWCDKFTRDAADGLAALTQLERLTLKGWQEFDGEQWAKLRAMPNLKVLESETMRETLRK